MEVDGGVLLGAWRQHISAPVHRAPVTPRRGQVHEPPAEPVGTDVDDVEPLDGAREIPRCHEPGGGEQRVEHERLRRARHGAEQQRVLDLAVEVRAGVGRQARADQERDGGVEPGRGREGRRRLLALAPRQGNVARA